VAFSGKDGSSTPFVRETLLQSLYESLKHRPNALTEALALTDTVINKLLPRVSQAKLNRTDVIQVAHQVLQRFDRAAAVHYQAYHPI